MLVQGFLTAFSLVGGAIPIGIVEGQSFYEKEIVLFEVNAGWNRYICLISLLFHGLRRYGVVL